MALKSAKKDKKKKKSKRGESSDEDSDAFKFVTDEARQNGSEVDQKTKKSKKDKLVSVNHDEPETRVAVSDTDQKEVKKRKKRSREEISPNFFDKRIKSSSDDSKSLPHRPRTRSMDVDETKNVDKERSKENPPVTSFNICEETVNILSNRGIKTLFPIQAQTFDQIYGGSDLIGRARTGMGKTLAFALPIIERLLSSSAPSGSHRFPRVIVMAPTRELAKQVSADFESTAPRLRTTTIYGGAPYSSQENALNRGVDIVVGTPGRIIDMMDRGNLVLDKTEFFVLDEADQMLDMGFKEEMERVFLGCKGKERQIQILLFSATMPDWVKSVAKEYMSHDHLYIDLVGNTEAKASQDVQHIAVPCQFTTRVLTINDVISVYCAGGTKRTLIFCQTKNECNSLCMDPEMNSECQALHGDISQAVRESTLAGFRKGKFRVLVATDVAARGLDMIVDLVINVEPPTTRSRNVDTETYVHRSGRTGRAGRKGICVTLYTTRQRSLLAEIENRTKNPFHWKGSPQPDDIINACAEAAAEDIADVDDKVLPRFRALADRLIEENGPENALCAALACMTGHKKALRARSLLTNALGFVTVSYTPKYPIPNTSAVWAVVREVMGPNVSPNIQDMQISADKSAAVFDIEDSVWTKLNTVIVNDGRFSLCTEMPKLEIQERGFSMGSGRTGMGGRSGGFGRGGRFSRGGRAGGFGQGSFGRSRGGRYPR